MTGWVGMPGATSGTCRRRPTEFGVGTPDFIGTMEIGVKRIHGSGVRGAGGVGLMFGWIASLGVRKNSSVVLW